GSGGDQNNHKFRVLRAGFLPGFRQPAVSPLAVGRIAPDAARPGLGQAIVGPRVEALALGILRCGTNVEGEAAEAGADPVTELPRRAPLDGVAVEVDGGPLAFAVGQLAADGATPGRLAAGRPDHQRGATALAPACLRHGHSSVNNSPCLSPLR